MGYRQLKGWEVLEIVDYYEDGGTLGTMPLADMAERYGVTPQAILNATRRWGVPLRGAPRTLRKTGDRNSPYELVQGGNSG